MPDADDVLKALQQRFLERAAEELVLLRDGACGPHTPDFASLVHRLAGAAGTFGFPEVSGAAGAVDQALARGDGVEPSRLEALIKALEALPQAA